MVGFGRGWVLIQPGSIAERELERVRNSRECARKGWKGAGSSLLLGTTRPRVETSRMREEEDRPFGVPER